MEKNNLAAERKRLGLTQAEAAKRLGIAPKTLAKYEANPLAMPGDFIVKAVNLFGCSASYLLGLTPERRMAVA